MTGVDMGLAAGDALDAGISVLLIQDALYQYRALLLVATGVFAHSPV